MILKKSYLILFAAAAAAISVSCKEDEAEQLPYLEGSLALRGVPTYVDAEDATEYHIEPYGVTHPEGRGIGYRWRVTPSDSTSYTISKEEDEDGDGSFYYNFHEHNRDTLRTLTISCEAFAEGYTGSSVSYYVTVVASGENGSIQHAGYDFSGDKIILDGVEYLVYTAPDGKTWMKQNLAYSGEEGNTGAPFQGFEVMSDIFGRFYTWEEATGGQSSEGRIQGICPDGWHLPSDQEWTDLANATMKAKYPDWQDMDSNGDWSADGYRISREFLAGELLSQDSSDGDEDYDSDIEYGKEARSATFNTDTVLWEYLSEVGDPTNHSGISAIPSGYARSTNGMWSFYGEYEYAIFWTADTDPLNSSKAICRVINNESPAVFRESHDKTSFAASVRCVKDE